MGQQQLLLIVLGVILVGVAVVLGIQYFGVGAEEGAKDELVAHSQIIGANAQQWFKKPNQMDGGGHNFSGFATYFDTKLSKLHNSTNGTYTVASPDSASCTITAEPFLAEYDWTVETTVTADDIQAVVTPN